MSKCKDTFLSGLIFIWSGNFELCSCLVSVTCRQQKCDNFPSPDSSGERSALTLLQSFYGQRPILPSRPHRITSFYLFKFIPFTCIIPNIIQRKHYENYVQVFPYLFSLALSESLLAAIRELGNCSRSNEFMSLRETVPLSIPCYSRRLGDKV